MITVKRVWIKQPQVSNLTESLDIWDSGSHIYERRSDGTEQYWKIIERKQFEEGFEELLEKMPEWESPSLVLHRERLPFQPQEQNEFLVGGWKVTQMFPSQEKKAYTEGSKKGQREHTRGSEHHKKHGNKNSEGTQAPQIGRKQPRQKAQLKA